jgi:hypothetical protein
MGSIIQTEDINSVNSLISSEIGRGVRTFFTPYLIKILVNLQSFISGMTLLPNYSRESWLWNSNSNIGVREGWQDGVIKCGNEIFSMMVSVGRKGNTPETNGSQLLKVNVAHYLLCNIIPIALIYLKNPIDPSREDLFQFFDSDGVSNFVHLFKKSVRVWSLHPVQSILHGTEQVKVTEAQIGGIWGLSHENHLMIRYESFRGSACVNWTVIHLNHESFCMPFPTSRTALFVNWWQHIGHIQGVQKVLRTTYNSASGDSIPILHISS